MIWDFGGYCSKEFGLLGVARVARVARDRSGSYRVPYRTVYTNRTVLSMLTPDLGLVCTPTFCKVQ